MALAGFSLAVYFRAVTGSPALTPYQINQKTYGWPMTLAWQDPPQVEHRHKELRDYYNWERAEHDRLKSPGATAAVLMQMVRPETPLIYATLPTVADMRSGAYASGGIECGMLHMAFAQMAHFYNVPCGGYIGLIQYIRPSHPALLARIA